MQWFIFWTTSETGNSFFPIPHDPTDFGGINTLGSGYINLKFGEISSPLLHQEDEKVPCTVRGAIVNQSLCENFQMSQPESTRY